MKRRYFRVETGLLVALLCFTLCACGTTGSPESPTPTPEPTVTSTEQPSPTPVITEEPEPSGEPMSEEMLQWFNEVFNEPYPHGRELVYFLTSEYSKPTEIDGNALFYQGAGCIVGITDEQKDDLAAKGYLQVDWREDKTGRVALTSLMPMTSMEELLQKRLGLTFSELEKECMPGCWVEEYDAYLVGVGNAYLGDLEFQSGYSIGDDTYVMDYYTEGTGNLFEGTYRVTITMTDDDLDSIMFISNVKIG